MLLRLLAAVTLACAAQAADTLQRQPDWSLYTAGKRITPLLRGLATAHPDYVSLRRLVDPQPPRSSISSRYDGRQTEPPEIMAVTVTAPRPPGGNLMSKVRVLVWAGEHPRELLPTELALEFLHLLLLDKGKTGLTVLYREEYMEALLTQVEFTVVPMVNPSGRAMLEGGAECARTSGSLVDLNRNWPEAWRNGSAAGEMYHGTAPWSEPETRMLSQLVRSVKPHMWINLHAGGMELLTPVDHSAAAVDDVRMPLMNELIANVRKQFCPDCAAGSGGGGGRYLAYGTAMDWVFAHAKATVYALTYELFGDADASDCYGKFNPTTLPQLQETMRQWLQALLASSEQALLQLRGRVLVPSPRKGIAKLSALTQRLRTLATGRVVQPASSAFPASTVLATSLMPPHKFGVLLYPRDGDVASALLMVEIMRVYRIYRGRAVSPLPPARASSSSSSSSSSSNKQTKPVSPLNFFVHALLDGRQMEVLRQTRAGGCPAAVPDLPWDAVDALANRPGLGVRLRVSFGVSTSASSVRLQCATSQPEHSWAPLPKLDAAMRARLAALLPHCRVPRLHVNSFQAPSSLACAAGQPTELLVNPSRDSNLCCTAMPAVQPPHAWRESDMPRLARQVFLAMQLLADAAAAAKEKAAQMDPMRRQAGNSDWVHERPLASPSDEGRAILKNGGVSAQPAVAEEESEDGPAGLAWLLPRALLAAVMLPAALLFMRRRAAASRSKLP